MVKLNLKDIEFMLAVLSLPDHLRRTLEQLRNGPNIGISDDSAEELLELCADRLLSHGFDDDYVANAEGNKLESLIDKFNAE